MLRHDLRHRRPVLQPVVVREDLQVRHHGENPRADFLLEAVHHREHYDQRPHAKGDADHRDRGIDADEAIAAFGPRIAQADGELVSHREAREYYNRRGGLRDLGPAEKSGLEGARGSSRHAAGRRANGVNDALHGEQRLLCHLPSRQPARMAHAGHAAASARRAVDFRDRRPPARSVHADARHHPGRGREHRQRRAGAFPAEEAMAAALPRAGDQLRARRFLVLEDRAARCALRGRLRRDPQPFRRRPRQGSLMPFTPFHFGPGAAIKAALGRRFSFTVFAFSQVLIDIEPGTRMLAGADQLHPHLHTYAGATAVALLSAWPGRPVCEWTLRLWNRQLSPAQARWLGVEPTIPAAAVWSGAIIGAYSHVVLDSIMHADLRPFAPLSDTNRLLHLISISDLHLLCIALGALGVAALAVSRWRKTR